ncbi:MAG: 1-deoxy-D-xylulose-5-phosphate synthase [Oscillospiraceae bacterium]|jgi:1-deoxy-D-xylulose-5-phosphate synthase|nr:1-deoxy-D-xylulose-5-phosphate synthase [Oscillospiraceae bacterium]
MDAGGLLEQIHSPAELRSFAPEQLTQLAEEIRDTLIRTVSRTGGHLASNLGVVELTLALHLCFDSPDDALVWDVGHQTYTHKLLTDRWKDFGTLRQSHGLSGFSAPQESPHDLFLCGHASASISAALGLAEARAMQGNPRHTVAILGDGAMTGGLAYEAMNNAGRNSGYLHRPGMAQDGHGLPKLIVILNDNEMSISKNVGSLAGMLSRLRVQPMYRLTKQRVERRLRQIPLVGGGLARLLHSFKEQLKRIFYPSATFFQDLGFDYTGPIDGHDLDLLCRALQSAKLARRPILVHVRTVKGRGYNYAEQSPSAFHGVAPFDMDSGEPPPGQDGSFSAVFGQSLCELAAADPSVCAVTAAMSLGTGLHCFEQQFPRRFFDVGIAEGHAVTFAAGLACQGMRPVFAVYSTFLQRGYDQLLHDGALQGRPLVIAADRAGFVGEDGPTHHGLYDVAFLRSIPGVTVFSPSGYNELRLCLWQALYDCKNLAVVRYPRGAEGAFPRDFIPSGAPYVTRGDGKAFALVTYGRLFSAACAALRQLEQEGLRGRIVKLTQVHPLDPGALDAVLDCACVAFFEEGIRSGGAGEAFGEGLLERRFQGRFRTVAVEGFVRQAPMAELLAEYRLDAAGMTEELRRLTA